MSSNSPTGCAAITPGRSCSRSRAPTRWGTMSTTRGCAGRSGAPSRKTFGHGVRIGRGAIARHPETFEIGDGVVIGEQAFIQGRFDGRCVIGDHTLDRTAGLPRRPRSRWSKSMSGWGPGARVLGSQHTGDAGRRARDSDRPPHRTGAGVRLGRRRGERGAPAGRHRRAGRDRRRRGGGHGRRPAVCSRDRGAGALRALARGPRGASRQRHDSRIPFGRHCHRRRRLHRLRSWCASSPRAASGC